MKLVVMRSALENVGITAKKKKENVCVWLDFDAINLWVKCNIYYSDGFASKTIPSSHFLSLGCLKSFAPPLDLRREK